MKPHARRQARAILRRARSRSANEQLAYAADILDGPALRDLGIVTGTTVDGKLLMSRGDWRRAIAGGAVAVDPEARLMLV